MGVYYIHLCLGYAMTMVPIASLKARGMLFVSIITVISFGVVFVMDKVAEKFAAMRWIKYMVV